MIVVGIVQVPVELNKFAAMVEEHGEDNDNGEQTQLDKIEKRLNYLVEAKDSEKLMWAKTKMVEYQSAADLQKICAVLGLPPGKTASDSAETLSVALLGPPEVRTQGMKIIFTNVVLNAVSNVQTVSCGCVDRKRTSVSRFKLPIHPHPAPVFFRLWL